MYKSGLLAVVLGFVFSIHALGITASAGSLITGEVRDKKSGEAIIGATVQIENSSVATATDLDGKFSLKNIPIGKQTIVCRYLSYKTVRVPVNVKQGESIAGLEIEMEEDGVALNEVVVSTYRRNDTEMSLLEGMKAQVQVASGISSQQIAKTLDRDASEVVKRVPGISVIDDRFVVVRGLSQRYNNVWINGNSSPSLESDSRAFSFDMLPSSQIENMIIYKSPAPEIPADFAGGFIRISTKSLPLRNSIQIGYTTGFNTNTQFVKTRLNPGNTTDWLGFDLNKRPLPNGMPSHMDVTGSNPAEVTRLTRSFNNDWRVKNYYPIPDQRLSLTINRRFETEGGTDIGMTTYINYSNTYKTIQDITNARFGIYSSDADKPVYLNDYVDNQYSNDVRLGAMHNWAFVFDGKNKLEFRNLFNMLGKNRLTERSGERNVSGLTYREETEMLYQSRLSYLGQLTGNHFLDEKKLHSLAWNMGYSYAYRTEPDRRIVVNQAGMSDGVDVSQLKVGNESIKRYFQSLSDHVFSGSVDYKGTVPMGEILSTAKGGLISEYRTRNYTPREFIYRYENLSLEERASYLYLPYEEMMSEDWLSVDKVFIDEITDKKNAYEAYNIYGAGYGAIELPMGKFNVYAGLRLEYNRLRMKWDKSQSASQVLMTSRNYTDLDLLPSVNATYNFDERNLLRLAYGRSLNRAEFREVSPAVYYDFDLFNEIGGNENLKTCKIDNLDFRYEFYPQRGEVISLGIFYKYFKNPIEWTFIDMGGSLRYNYENALSAQSFGAEIEIRKSLDFLGMRGLSLLLNATLIKSRVRFDESGIVKTEDREMQGQSPYIVNAGLYYQNEKWGLMSSLLYNRLGKRIIGIGKSNSTTNDVSVNIPDTYELPRNSLDFTVSKKFGKLVELKAGVKDIIGEKVVYKQYPQFYDAEGTSERPIVFTSAQAPGKRKPGDWGGIILLGKAKNNMGEQTIEGGVRSKHGGNDDTDNSGVLKYVRCEFAGIEYSTDNEINAITFGSVGSGTTVDYVQVSYSGDDSYEWFGGSVNCKHLVALGTWDDDFDTDNGFSGKLQFLAALRNPKIGDKSASNGFESDNCADAATVEPYTSCVFANVSMFGPVLDPTNYTNEAGVNGSLTDARFQAAMHLRRNTQLRVFNSVFAGFPIGLIIENDKNSKTQTHATEGKLVVSNCVFAGMVKNYQDAQYWANGTQFDPSDNGAFADSYFNREGGKNIAYTAIDDLKLQGDPQNLTSFCMVPSQDSPLVSQSADWSHSLVSSGFEQVAYIGAFGPTETAANNWTTGWTNMDPQNTVY